MDGCVQVALSYCTDREDAVSMALTATQQLLDSYGVHPDRIGRWVSVCVCMCVCVYFVHPDRIGRWVSVCVYEIVCERVCVSVLCSS